MSEFKEVEILLVEDSPADAELTMRALKRRNLANNLVWVRDGAEALDFLFRRNGYAGRSDQHPKLVLLDLKMPKVSGLQVLAQVKADDRTKNIPVVVLTSSQEEPDLAEAYKLGVNSYLQKPVAIEKFLDVVSEAGLYWLVMNKASG